VEEDIVRITVIQLRGHLFFGNIQQVVDSIEFVMKQDDYKENFQKAPNLTLATYLVLDCSFVTGADINAVGTLSKFKRKLRRRGYANILYAGLESDLYSIFHIEDASLTKGHKHDGDDDDDEDPVADEMETRKAKILIKNSAGMDQEFFPDVNSALQAVEEDILDNVPTDSVAVDTSVERRTSTMLPSTFLALTQHHIVDLIKTPSMMYARLTANGDSDDRNMDVSNGDSNPLDSLVEGLGAKLRTGSFDGTLESQLPRGLTSQELEDLTSLIHMIFNIGARKWSENDGPAIKRLAKRLLKDIKTVYPGETLWKSGDPATSVGTVI
jgi:hypothetical protein